MIKELAFHQTPLGPLSLRVRPEPAVGGIDVYEVKLGDEFLMSSLFTAGEEALAILGLQGLSGPIDVVVGGLGLGYTAAKALEVPNVSSLLVVEAFEEVIRWHKEQLVPASRSLTEDSRCTFINDDFFVLAETGLDPSFPGRRFDAVLVDIDHTPEHHLDTANAAFYSSAGLKALKRHLKPEGVFALWSDDECNGDFVNLLRSVFGTAEGHNIKFANPYTDGISVNSVYVSRLTRHQATQ